MKPALKKILLSLFLLSSGYPLSATSETTFDPGLSGLVIQVKNELIPYRVFALFIMPDEVIPIQIHHKMDDLDYILTAETGEVTRNSSQRWIWHSPGQPGVYQLKITSNDNSSPVNLFVFVMVPFDQLHGESLNGYKIGKYPDTPYQQLSIYENPAGFVEVTPQNKDTPLSPHFRLGQFVSKQKSDYPKYLVLKERLLLKLEMILSRANQLGIKASSFVIMSGYRTPFYNQLIKNVTYSRHVWGGAADIYIDENPKDGMMDDLNNDGTNNYLDAEVLYRIIDDLYGKPFYEGLIGGLGRYRKTANHGPFVHVDVRGFKARW